MENPDYAKVLWNWRIESTAITPVTTPPEQPNQKTASVIATDVGGAMWALEYISQSTYARHLQIAEILEQLENLGCRFIHPYQRNSLGQFTTFYSGELCMLRPYMKGISLPSEQWTSESWRADALADVIINLHRCSKKATLPDDGKAFALIDFVKRRTETFTQHRPDVAESLSDVYNTLNETLFPTLTSLPVSFCHGDLKPEDIIWGEDALRSVVNWQYCGMKPEAYDAALLVGCIGFDNPDKLVSDFTTRFIHRLKEAALFDEGTWAVFYDLILASRYGWLSEWMRTHQEKKRDLEMLYMNLLVTQRNYIVKKWRLD